MRRHVLCAISLASPLAFAQGLPPVPQPAENPITESKRVLGKILFWDEQLSFDNTVACGSCHMPEHGGADPVLARHPGPDGINDTIDDLFASLGVIRTDDTRSYTPDSIFDLDVQVTSRSAQQNLLSMYSPELFWDGRAPTTFVDPQTGATSIAVGGALESQAVGPVLSDVEMAHEGRDWDAVAAKLEVSAPLAIATDLPADVQSILDAAPSYPDLFEDAFGDPSITAERIAFAIATYQRTLVPDQTPWDRFIAGEPNAMTPGQVQGWNAFQASNCAACHQAPFFTDHTFRIVAVRPAAEDLGRFEVTGANRDRGRFKVPTVRNVGLKSSFMHTGQFRTLDQVLQFYAGPGARGTKRDPLLPRGFAPQVRPAGSDFLESALTDPRVEAGY
ncbi:MAG: hypothetical protein KDA28_06140, partial [Phycisphaerales bacterium]|nr:hypothetical protein [Phycisphaerales bacterium]